MKKTIAVLLCALLAGGAVLSGCSADPVETKKAEASTDKYRNFYQIFVNSFCDSNGDKTGDLKGIISQLDYLNDGDPNSGDDLGIDGLWLTPIMPSKSYHKYDVENYYDIDPDFGTLEDFDELVKECNERGINIIIDLVLNHISYNNPLFQQAVTEVSEGNLDGAAKYFEIHKSDYFSDDTQVVRLWDGYVCEANFSQDMPEWDLNSEKTREEFTKIAKFWLEERKVDGFRLDACKFFQNKTVDGTEFLKWFYDTCKGIKEDVYMVGEDWTEDSDIQDLYKSGIDSLFSFKFAQNTGQIVGNMNTMQGATFAKKLKAYEGKMRESNPNAINAYFLSNHDQVRIANALQSKGLDFEKFAANVYMLMPGNSFTYYGEEIGTKAESNSNDAYYRTAMVFDSNNLPSINVGNIGSTIEPPVNGGVKQQLADKNSLLNHYRRLIKVKNQNPAIARGEITDLADFGDKEIAAYYNEYDGKKLMIVHNFNGKEAKQLEITAEMLENPEIAADLSTFEATRAELKNGKLTLPPHGSVVLETKVS